MHPVMTDVAQDTLLLCRCICVGESEGRPAVQVEHSTAEEQARQEWVPCLAGARVAAGDQVLLAAVSEPPGWVAVGALAESHEMAPAVHAVLPASGFSLEADAVGAEDRVRLRTPEGKLQLDIRIIDGRTHLRCATRDAVLECEGSLEVRAGESLRLCARDYELQVSKDARTQAGGKIEVEAAEQELRSQSGVMRLTAKKNVVLWGEFILLNTQDETPWRLKT